MLLCYVCRLSATELLKLPFFKKAKNKEFIREVVVGDAPNLQSRAKKVISHAVTVFIPVCIISMYYFVTYVGSSEFMA